MQKCLLIRGSGDLQSDPTKSGQVPQPHQPDDALSHACQLCTYAYHADGNHHKVQ